MTVREKIEAGARADIEGSTMNIQQHEAEILSGRQISEALNRANSAVEAQRQCRAWQRLAGEVALTRQQADYWRVPFNGLPWLMEMQATTEALAAIAGANARLAEISTARALKLAAPVDSSRLFSIVEQITTTSRSAQLDARLDAESVGEIIR